MEYRHLAVDDHAERAYREIPPDEARRCSLKFLINALRFFRDHGGKVLRGMTGHGISSRSLNSRQSVANAENQAQAQQTLSAKNNRKGRTLRAGLLAGMGEAGPVPGRQSLLEWPAEGYAKPPSHSPERAAALLPFLPHDIDHRRRFGINGCPL